MTYNHQSLVFWGTETMVVTYIPSQAFPLNHLISKSLSTVWILKGKLRQKCLGQLTFSSRDRVGWRVQKDNQTCHGTVIISLPTR
jgi:hypothetical protein